MPGLGGVVRAPVPEGVEAGAVVAEQGLPRHVVHQAAAARPRAAANHRSVLLLCTCRPISVQYYLYGSQVSRRPLS